jgi:hypothetical protein
MKIRVYPGVVFLGLYFVIRRYKERIDGGLWGFVTCTRNVLSVFVFLSETCLASRKIKIRYAPQNWEVSISNPTMVPEVPSFTIHLIAIVKVSPLTVKYGEFMVTHQSNSGLCRLVSQPLYNAPFGPN